MIVDQEKKDIPLPQFQIRASRCYIVNGLANIVNFSLVHRDGGVGHLLVADVACLLQFLVDTLDVFVQVGNCQSLSTVRTLRTLIVVHLSNVPTQVAHCELLLTVRTRFLNPLMRLSHMS